ncbi:MAG: MAPEG family protein [Pseudomonadota bacterium]
MKPTLLLWPLAAQILLTLLLLIPLASRKKAAVRAGEVDLERSAIDNSAWPESVLRVSNNFQNQFQIPVLFYAIILALVVLQQVSVAAVVLAWVFVASRIAHSLVHIRTNYVPHRMRIFIVGFLTLLGLCGVLIWELVQA